MNLNRVVAVALFALLQANVARSEEPARERLLVVQTLVADATDKDLSLFATDLTEELVVRAGALSRPNGVRVRSESELRLIAEHVKDMSDLRREDCKKLEECLARLFEGEADQVLRGTLGRLGDQMVVTLRLIDLKTLGVVRAGSCAAESKEELIAALHMTAAEVLGYASSAIPEPGISVPADGRKIGVVPLSGSAADERNARVLTETLGVSIRELGYGTVTKGDLLSMIHYATQRTHLSGAALTDAMMEIAGSSGVSMLVTGSIGRVEKTNLIVLKLIDLNNGEVVGRVLESYIGEESSLPSAMKYACARLFGRLPSGQSGPVSIVVDVEGTFRIDQGRNEPLPQVIAKTDVAAGKHQLNVTSPGNFPYFADLYLFEGEALRYRPQLEPLPEPWYESPVFLSLAGIVVAGAATAIVLAAIPDGSGVGPDFDR